MKTWDNLYYQLCSYENLESAFREARKKKIRKNYVITFESNLEANLKQLQRELENFTYSPAPLTTFVVRDPKTRIISASHFRDRVIHHALCNIIEPILAREFIYDSFANQKGKGTHLAIKRFEKFMKKVGGRTQRSCGGGQRKLFDKQNTTGYVLKADIRHYFDTVDHEVLIDVIKRRIKDTDVLWLIQLILKNHRTDSPGKGMPIGNLTSQFFANVYLHELDIFVKHKLKAKYYLRYVDDFVILNRDKETLRVWKEQIDKFLIETLKIELHPEKSRIIMLNNGVTIFGFRVFSNHRLLKKSNISRIWKRLEKFRQEYNANKTASYEGLLSLEGWLAYARFGNTHNLRKKVLDRYNDIVLKLADGKKDHTTENNINSE